MKTLKDFIFEKNRVNNTVNNNADLQPQTKAFTFNIKDVENAEETATETTVEEVTEETVEE